MMTVDVLSTLASVIHVGDPDGVPRSLLYLGLILTVVTIWGVNQMLNDLSLFLCLCLSLSHYVSNTECHVCTEYSNPCGHALSPAVILTYGLVT